MITHAPDRKPSAITPRDPISIDVASCVERMFPTAVIWCAHKSLRFFCSPSTAAWTLCSKVYATLSADGCSGDCQCVMCDKASHVFCKHPGISLSSKISVSIGCASGARIAALICFKCYYERVMRGREKVSMARQCNDSVKM